MVNLQAWYSALRRQHIVEPVLGDRRNRPPQPHDGLWGHPVEWIKWQAIGGGQADFDQGVKHLKPDDLALLYAYLNQKGHVEELVLAFQQLLGKDLTIDGRVVIDVGCGPFTAGLALANVMGKCSSFDYYGADRATSMRAFGQVLANATRDAGALHDQTRVSFLPDVKDIPILTLRSTPTLVVLSYLLASTTLDVEATTADILAVCDRISMGPVDVLYTNSVREEAGRNFPVLKARLEAAGFKEIAGGRVDLPEISSYRRIHYALFHRGPKTLVPEHLFI
jgi:hypothetical protein